MKLNICPDCKKETLALATYSRGLGHAEYHHFCDDCKKTHVITAFDMFKEAE